MAVGALADEEVRHPHPPCRILCAAPLDVVLAPGRPQAPVLEDDGAMSDQRRPGRYPVELRERAVRMVLEAEVEDEVDGGSGYPERAAQMLDELRSVADALS
jgi:hypothetical protein